jgi:hypothetical protein
MSKLRRFRDSLSYANVVSTLCLFLLLGGGAAYAANQLGRNTVGPKQLKKNAVTAAKIKANAVKGSKVQDGSLTGADLADNSITGAKVQDGSLTGADLSPSTLSGIKASNVIGFGISGDNTCDPATPLPASVTIERVGGVGSGECKITFPSSVANCAITATPRFRNAGFVVVEKRTAEVLQFSGSPNAFFVDTWGGSSSATANQPFDVVMVC